jgi:thioredoxin-like negative regulator of GroEL
MAMLKTAPRPAPVELLYFRPTCAGCTALDQALVDVAAAHRGHVRLIVKHSDECGYLFGGWVSGTSPTVLLIRDGVMVAEFVGTLPAREIDGLVRASLSRPDDPDCKMH